MTDQEVLDRAAHAKQILDDEVFKEAVLAVDEQIVAEWRVALTGEIRETAHYRLHALNAVVSRIRGMMEDGEILKTRLEKQERQQ